MKVMVVSPYLPHARVGHGGGTAVRDLVTWLARDHQVLLVSLLRPGEAAYVHEVESLGHGDNLRVEVIPFLDNMARGVKRLGLLRSRVWAAGRALASGYPLYVAKYRTGQVSRSVLRLARQFQPDAIQIEYLQLSLLCRDLRRWRNGLGLGGPRLILNSHELGSVPRQRRAAREKNPWARLLLEREAAAWRRLQVDATGWADTTLCVTEDDHALYRQMGGRHLETVPLGMDTEKVPADWAPAGPERFLFVGSFGHRPNVQAARFLVERVWPALAEERPTARLILAGPGSHAWLDDWRRGNPSGGERVEALGFVPDLRSLFRECRLFLAPLAEGGGIKIKILEALARGVPVVTTPIGAEGIAAPEADALFLAPCDDGFLAAVRQALDDPREAARRAANGRRLIEQRFSWESITRRLAELYRQA